MPEQASTPSSSPQGSEGPSRHHGSQRSGAPAASDPRRHGEGEARPGLFDRLRQLMSGRRSSGSLRSDLTEVLTATATDAGADLTTAERTMLKSVLGMRELRIGDLMVPRADIVAVQKDISLGKLLTVFANAGHSRLVVYDDTLDDPVGMVHIRDLVAHLTQRAMTPRRETNAPRSGLEPTSLPREDESRSSGKTLPAFNLKAIDLGTSLSAAKLIRRLLFVPPSMPSVELLASMQASRIHLALVIDEYGGTDGIVSMEDLVEVIVGDIEDEHDDDAPMIARQPDGSFIADARASLEEVAETVDPAFGTGEEAEEVDTLGGLLVTLAGRVPVRGEIVAVPGDYEIEVLDADPRRLKRLRISPARGTAPLTASTSDSSGAEGSESTDSDEQSMARPPTTRDPDAT